MPAYHRSDVAGDLYADIERVIEALHKNRPGPALGLLDSLLNGPYSLAPLELPEQRTLARRVCSCGRFMGYKLWAGDDAHPGKAYMDTHGICDACFARAQHECLELEERTA